MNIQLHTTCRFGRRLLLTLVTVVKCEHKRTRLLDSTVLLEALQGMTGSAFLLFSSPTSSHLSYTVLFEMICPAWNLAGKFMAWPWDRGSWKHSYSCHGKTFQKQGSHPQFGKHMPAVWDEAITTDSRRSELNMSRFCAASTDELRTWLRH